MATLAGALYLVSTAAFSMFAIVIGVRLIALGWIFHNLGVTFMLDFVQQVFRPDERWARILKYTLSMVLWGGWLVEVPTFLGYERMSPAAEHITSITMLCTSGFGIGTIFTYWLTFFPPAWYQERFNVYTTSGTSS